MYPLGDRVFMGTLLPWLEQVHEDCPWRRVGEFVNANGIGKLPMPPSPYRADLAPEGFRRAVKKFRFLFVLLEMNLVIQSERCRK